MSIQTALRFIQTVREEEALRREIHALGWTAELEQVVAIGRRIGLDFTADDLRDAFARDTGMRWAFYQSRTAPAAPDGIRRGDRGG